MPCAYEMHRWSNLFRYLKEKARERNTTIEKIIEEEIEKKTRYEAQTSS